MKKLPFLVMYLLFINQLVGAQINGEGLWYPIGNTIMSEINDDEDNGDGANDGALLFDGQDENGPLGARFAFNGNMESGKAYNISTFVYNTKNSYVNFTIALYNKTDDKKLAESALVVLKMDDSPMSTKVDLNYTATPDDVGDELEVRYIRGNLHVGRDFKVDNLSLNGNFVSEKLPAFSADGAWDKVGDVLLETVMTDGDNGDGVNDGALYVDGQSSVVGQGAEFAFTETMSEGERYKAITTIYNSDASYVVVKIALYNATDNILLAESADVLFNGSAGLVHTLGVFYDAKASDAGDQLVLRYVRTDDGNTSRNFNIDVAKINGATISTTVTPTSIEKDVLRNNISIYPNPATDVLNINATGEAELESVNIMSLSGKLVYKGIYTRNPIEVSTLPKGVYLIQLNGPNASIIKKIIIN